MSGECRIDAPRVTVWAALNDPATLKLAIPGCEEIEKLSDTEFAATVKLKIGPISASLSGSVRLSDLDPPKSYTISGEGKGGPVGFAKGGAKVLLEESGGATVLSYEVNAQVGGKLAQIGSRLVDATVKMMADDFFSGLAEALAGPAQEEAVPEVRASG
jgi:carbon monoxide dehydrogenase subunit G